MRSYLLRRSAGLVAALICASLLVFLVLQILPGDPALVILGPDARPDTLAALRHQLGLDVPAWLRYLRWVAGLLHGNLGQSVVYDTPVTHLIAGRLAVTLPLAGLAMGLAVALALPLGIWASARPGRWDGGIMSVTQMGIAIPDFWLALLLILLFSVHLAWFPAGGFPGWAAGPGRALGALLLPAVALALPQAAILTRVVRGAMKDTVARDFLRTARAKGQSARGILWRHALPNALIPITTLIGLQTSFLLAGTIIIETVFTLPGLGALLFEAIGQRDLVVVQDLVLLFAVFVIVINFLVDVLNALIDPRLACAPGR